MSDQRDFATIARRGTRNPARVVSFSSPTRWTHKGVTKSSDGRIEVLGQPGEILIVALDFSTMLDDDEAITVVSASGAAVVQGFTHSRAMIAFDTFGDCPIVCSVAVEFSTGERMRVRLRARTAQFAPCDLGAGDPVNRRGTL